MTLAPYMIVMGSAAFIVFYVSRDKRNLREAALAILITAVWVACSGIYSYKSANLAILGFNLFPFFSWIAGLLLLRAAYKRLGQYKYLKAVILYLFILLTAEYLGYHLLGIQLDSDHPGLFGLPLLHAPRYAQMYYLSMGPIFLLIFKLLDKKEEAINADGRTL